MFTLVIIEDKFKITPDQFDEELKDMILEQIELKYINKVLPEAGLCISFYDFLEIDDPYIYPAEGSTHQQIKFRLVVFQPFEGEIITGKVVDSNPNGIRISIDFFSDIHIPSTYLQEPSEFDSSTGLWTWKYIDSEDTDVIDSTGFTIEKNDMIRFRVMSLNFMKDEVISMKYNNDSTEVQHTVLSTNRKLENPGNTVPPMQIIGSMNEQGLGVTTWWQN